jgi:hypothetical protein
MRVADYNFMAGIYHQAMVDVSKQPPSQWCSENLYFDEPKNHGPFKLTGREYIRDILDDFASHSITDEVIVKGSQLGGTGTIMGGAAWRAVNNPCRTLWVMPNVMLAISFSSTRWQPMLEASEATRKLIPTGASRHEFKNLEQRLGASIFNFAGSNSAANLSSNPCDLIILDEVDKFDFQGVGDEADAVNLAEQRSKRQIDPQRWKISTPTIIEALIWQEFLKGNQCQYEVPCPCCHKRVRLRWSLQYTIIPKVGNEAYVVWDREARRKDGEWDLDRVARSARFRCPHDSCRKDFQDDKKTWMVRDGVWVPTNSLAASSFVSRQISSLYACSPETSCGTLAIKFLAQKRTYSGLQGFINGDLAEPYLSQDTQGKRTESIVIKSDPQTEDVQLLTSDVQARRFWYVIGRWSPRKIVDGHNVKAKLTITHAGPLDTVEEIRAAQLATKPPIQDVGVMIDSGYGTRSDAEIYVTCSRFGELEQRQDKLPLFNGWMPAKGMPSRKRWKDESGQMKPYYMRAIDPFDGTSDAGQIEMSLFEFAGDYFKDILDLMRKGRGPCEFEVVEDVANAIWRIDGKEENFWQHMDAEIKTLVYDRSGHATTEWHVRNRHWPNHLLDCVVENIALAALYGLLEIE